MHRAKDGNPIKAVITLLPDSKDAKTQRWTVTNIERRHVDVTSIPQQDAIRARMDAVYAAAAGSNVKEGLGMYHMSGERVYLTLRVAREGYAALKMHPLCVK